MLTKLYEAKKKGSGGFYKEQGQSNIKVEEAGQRQMSANGAQSCLRVIIKTVLPGGSLSNLGSA